MKDNFSDQSALYKAYRPVYPQAMYDFINRLLASKKLAWDCGTGNGQVAVALSAFMERVEATDISTQQLEVAEKKENVHYSCQPAEQTNFPDNYFDLVTVAQAIHWFDFDRFYVEVNRTLKQDGLIVVCGYGLITVNEDVDAVIQELYSNILAGYWDKERKYIDELLQTIPFPFREISAPEFINELYWDITQLLGYLNTWSAVKHYTKAKGHNPVNLITEKLRHVWGDVDVSRIVFPILLRVGKKPVQQNK